jgi:8-oxo-dGTP diphosphatase
MNAALPPPENCERRTGSPVSPARHLLTHRVAVGAYIFRNGKMLLLNRANFPRTYAPPGGRLELHEDPLEGTRREVREETGMEIQILGIAGIWFGRLNDGQPPMLGIDYFARTDTDDVILSDEHTGYLWATREDIRLGRVVTLEKWEFGYRPEALIEAFDLYERCYARESAE